jgi:3'-5' exoribonuclease
MQRIQVKDLKENDRVVLQPFAVSDLKVAQTKAGKEYASFKIFDKSGSMPAVWWEYGTAPETMKQTLLKDNIMDIGGGVSTYNNVLQFKVEGVVKSLVFEPGDFEKCSKYNPDKMWADFNFYVEAFQNDHFENIARVLIDKFGDEFKVCAAATGMHHAFKHGLLEHTLQMLDTGSKLFELPFYAEVLNKDLCMFGLMFHDFGKIWEYGPPPDFKRLPEGAKVPHIPAMAIEIAVECRALDVPKAIEREMESIILSHHRQIAWGSPVSFSSPEAAFVHFIDNLHGDVFGIVQRIENDTTSEPTVKHGFGSDSYTIVKKSMNQILIEEGAKNGYEGF